MPYAEPEDFREPTQASWASGLVLTAGDCSDPQLEATIAHIQTQIEADLNDDFEPPDPDANVTLDVNGTLLERLYLPRRIRALTTLSTINTEGTVTAIDTSQFRVHSSLTPDGLAFANGNHRESDWIDAYGWTWPIESGSVRLVGKFGWAAVPTDIKRLLAFSVYEMIKATSDPLTRVIQRSTIDSTITYGPSREAEEIRQRYNRRKVMVA